MSAEVKAVRVHKWDDLKEPGNFMFTAAQSIDGHAGMIICCPCGCRGLGATAFRNNTKTAAPKWDWDGNEESPTLTPSIQRTSECRWHGYLTAGVFKPC